MNTRIHANTQLTDTSIHAWNMHAHMHTLTCTCTFTHFTCTHCKTDGCINGRVVTLVADKL